MGLCRVVHHLEFLSQAHCDMLLRLVNCLPRQEEIDSLCWFVWVQLIYLLLMWKLFFRLVDDLLISWDSVTMSASGIKLSQQHV